MHDTRNHNHNMKYLVGPKQNIELARQYRLWNSRREEESPNTVKDTFEKPKRHPRSHPHFVPSIQPKAIPNRSKARQGGSYKSRNANSAIWKTLQSRMENEDAGNDAEGDDHGPISPEEDWLAIVPHVYAREERPQDESKNPHVIYP